MLCNSVDRLPMIQRNLLYPSSPISTLKMEAASSSKTLVPTYSTTSHKTVNFMKYLLYGKQQKHGHKLRIGRGGIKYCDNDGCYIWKITEVLCQLKR